MPHWPLLRIIAASREGGRQSMKKAIDILLKVVLSLILVLPILGTFGVLPAPTQDLYNTPEAFQFIATLQEGRYINIIMVVVHVVALVCLWTRRTALAALLILPITVNVVAFHAFLDGGLLTGGAVLGNIMLLINAYFLWQHRREYAPLLAQTS
jgi:putative oxidoreductase